MVRGLVLALLLSVMLGGCFFSPPNQSTPGAGDLSLTVTLPPGANVAKVSAAVMHTATKTVETKDLVVTSSSASGLFSKIPTGPWTIVVRAYDGSGTEIGVAAGSATVVNGQTTSVTLALSIFIEEDGDGLDWLAEVWTDPFEIPVGGPTEVRVMALVPKPPSELATPGEDESPVRVYVRFEAAGGPGVTGGWVESATDDEEFWGFLFDSGEDGDEIKGDRIYSGVLVFDEPQAGLITVRVVVTTAEGDNHEKSTVLSVVEVDGGIAIVIQSTHAAALEHLNNLPPGLSTDELIEELIEWLKEHPRVVNVERHDHVVQIDYDSGATSFIRLDDELSAGDNPIRGAASSRESVIPVYQQTRGDTFEGPRPDLAAGLGLIPLSLDFDLLAGDSEDENFIRSRQVLVWAPFAHEFAPWDETPGVIIRFSESDLGFQVTALMDEAADIDSLRNITQFGMVIFATHGMAGEWIVTGQGVQNVTDYALDIQKGRIGVIDFWRQTGPGEFEIESRKYSVHASWFAANLAGKFPNSVIVNNSCQSTASGAFWDVFQSKGAGAYLGYSKTVRSDFAVARVYELVEALRDGGTVGEGYKPATDPSTGALWQVLGNQELSFAQGFRNGSFEEGLTAWRTEGDGRAIYGLGFLGPQDGSLMGIVSTGLGFSEASGSISQAFRMDSDATVLTFRWNFLSEEYLEYIGSDYQDWFRVTITHEDHETELLHVTIDSLAAEYGAVYCHEEPLECNAMGANGNLEFVSPEIVFDQGGVYMTGWVTTTIDVSAFAGKTVTLTFAAHDISDSIYDTAVLIDDIRIE